MWNIYSKIINMDFMHHYTEYAMKSLLPTNVSNKGINVAEMDLLHKVPHLRGLQSSIIS